MGRSISVVCLSIWSTSCLAGFPDATVDWMGGPPMLNGQPAYTAVHAESRIKDFNPQVTQERSDLTGAPQWQPVILDLQPFRTAVDRVNGKVYWRKDFFDQCPAKIPCDFYGELFNFDD